MFKKNESALAHLRLASAFYSVLAQTPADIAAAEAVAAEAAAAEAAAAAGAASWRRYCCRCWYYIGSLYSYSYRGRDCRCCCY